MRDKQNVLFFIFRLYGGGAERVVSNLTMAFSDQYHVKIALFDNLEKTYPHHGELIRIKLPFSRDPTNNKAWQRLIRLLLLLRQLRKIKRKHRIDVTISFGEQANIVNILAGGRGRTVISVRTLLSGELGSASKLKILGGFVRLLYNRAQQIIVPSHRAAQDLDQHFGIEAGKLKVIYNYIEQEKIRSMDTEPIEDPFLRSLFDQPVLLNVGRITPAKGQWLLLEIMKKIRPAHPDWRLVIIGESETEGKLKNQLVALAERLDLRLYDSTAGQNPSLDYDVYLLGFKTNPFQYMHRSRVLVFPSVFEGFPNTVLEAMQSGLPVVAADCQSGPREILAPASDPAIRTDRAERTEFGILCPPLNGTDINDSIPSQTTDAWVQAIGELMSEDGLRNHLIERGYSRVRDFDKKAILADWKKSIDGIY
jgi:glycosyltransferase involved in cell wall biosynthesis